MLTIQHFIDGRYVDAASGQSFDKTDPATGQVVARVPDGDGRDVDAAVAAAAQAFPRWSRTPAVARARLFLPIAAQINPRLEQVAGADGLDGGLPVRRVAEAPAAPGGCELARFAPRWPA